MSWDSPDRRSLEIPPERVDRVIQAVFARLDASGGVVAARRTVIGRLGDWLAGLTPVPRFAMPMAAAALLGVVVGQHLQAAETAVQFADLFSVTSLYVLGF